VERDRRIASSDADANCAPGEWTTKEHVLGRDDDSADTRTLCPRGHGTCEPDGECGDKLRADRE
jgi:hypothetical protein